MPLKPNGHARYSLKTPYRDGSRHVILLRASCPPPCGPAFGCSKSLPAILSSRWIASADWRPWCRSRGTTSSVSTGCSRRTVSPVGVVSMLERPLMTNWGIVPIHEFRAAPCRSPSLGCSLPDDRCSSEAAGRPIHATRPKPSLESRPGSDCHGLVTGNRQAITSSGGFSSCWATGQNTELPVKQFEVHQLVSE